MILRFHRWLVVALFSLSGIAQADGFGINATRLIYPEGTKSISVSLRNTSSEVNYLVKSAVSQDQREFIAANFSVTPPLFRLEAESTNQVRITYLGDASLPQDRESVFYFQAMAIPGSKSPGGEINGVQNNAMVLFGIGSTIKLFYRPKGLSGTSEQAQRNLQFLYTAQGLKVTNPSAYFVSLNNVSSNGKSLPLNEPAALMIPPSGSYTWQAARSGGEVRWKTINDYGGVDSHVFSHP